MVDLNNIEICQGHNFMNNGIRTCRWMLLRILVGGYHFGTFMLHIMCSMFYYGKDKTVPPIQNKLLLKSATKLAADIREGKLKSEKLIQAYIDRIQEVEPYINATTYQRFTEAIKEAREADELVASGKMNRSQLMKEKPLLGIPLSIKQLIQVKGLPHTGASIDSKDVISEEDADVIKNLKEAGAIILVSTNAPEKGLNLETFNKLNGRTSNPYNISRSPSGSSGGEGALIGAGASLIGIGNDTAGSIRMPSLFCGIYGHKPTPGLISTHGQFANIGHITTIGPMCRYAEDLMLVMKVMVSNQKMFSNNISVNFKNIKVYYITSMGNYFEAPLDKEIKSTLEQVLSYFESTYEIKSKKVETPLLKKCEDIFRHNLITLSGDLETLKKALKMPVDINPTVELIKFVMGISKYTITVPFLLNFLKFPLWYKESAVPYYENLLLQLKQTFDEILDNNSVLICPTLPQTGLYHLETQYLATSLSYVGIWNFLELPATHCPLGLNKNGLPLGLQIVSSKNNDALNFAVANELQKAFGGWIPPQPKS